MAAQVGRVTEYRRLLDEAAAAADRQGMAEWARMAAASRIVVEAAIGNTSVSRGLAQAVLDSEKPSAKQLITAAFGLALDGDVAGAERALREAAAAAPGAKDDKNAKATLQAALEWKRGRPGRAVALLDQLELLAPKDASVFGAMVIRGEALLAAGRAKDAEAQFQAVLDHRAFAPFDIAQPLAQEGLGRARARAGDAAGARQAYEAFFAMWKDADPDVPLLKAARRDYGRLAGGS